jgi:hypothetical protein
MKRPKLAPLFFRPKRAPVSQGAAVHTVLKKEGGRWKEERGRRKNVKHLY